MHRRNGACLDEHPHTLYERALGRNRFRRSLARTVLTRTPEDGRTPLPSPFGFLTLTGTPTPGFEPRSRPRQDRMLPDYTTSARVSENAAPRTLTSTTAAIASGDARLCVVTALRVGTTYQRPSSTQRVRGRTFTPLWMRTEIRRPRVSPSWPGRERGTELWGECRRQARVPPPRAGSPRGGPGYAGRSVRASPERVAPTSVAHQRLWRSKPGCSARW
jgi:hypothetical protein